MAYGSFLTTLILTGAGLLGVPLVSLLAGAAAALVLALRGRSLAVAVGLLAVSLAAEYFSARIAPRRERALAQVGGLFVLGRLLGPIAGGGLWALAIGSELQPRELGTEFAARGLRVLGVLLALVGLSIGL